MCQLARLGVAVYLYGWSGTVVLTRVWRAARVTAAGQRTADMDEGIHATASSAPGTHVDRDIQNIQEALQAAQALPQPLP